MQIKKLISVGLVSILSLTCLTTAILAEDLGETTKEVEKEGSKKKKNKQTVTLPENAIDKDTAKQNALTDANLTTEQVDKLKSRVSTLDDETVIYKVSFIYNSQKYSYKIDAVSGNVLDKKNEAVTETTENKHSNSKKAKADKVTLPENAIGKYAAKQAALKDANLIVEQVDKVKSKVITTEDGTVIYKVKFKYDNQKYTYLVDAISGNILDKTVEAVSSTTTA